MRRVTQAATVLGIKNSVPEEQHAQFVILYQEAGELNRIVGFQEADAADVLLPDGGAASPGLQAIRPLTLSLPTQTTYFLAERNQRGCVRCGKDDKYLADDGGNWGECGTL